MKRLAAVLLALASFCPLAAHAFARGTVRVDVRDARGATTTAHVALKSSDGALHEAAHVGEVYIADSLVPGDYEVVIDVDGGGAWLGAARVTVHEKRIAGLVAVVGAHGKKAPPGLTSADAPGCVARDGQLIQAIAFARGTPGAGRLDVFRTAGQGKGKGKLLCVTAIAGGSADLALGPGDYWIAAEFVGGGSVSQFYRIAPDKPAPPLALRWK